MNGKPVESFLHIDNISSNFSGFGKCILLLGQCVRISSRFQSASKQSIVSLAVLSSWITYTILGSPPKQKNLQTTRFLPNRSSTYCSAKILRSTFLYGHSRAWVYPLYFNFLFRNAIMLSLSIAAFDLTINTPPNCGLSSGQTCLVGH